MEGAKKHLLPLATAVIAVVVARITSIAMTAYPFLYREAHSGKQSITKDGLFICWTSP